jgi:3-dehydroquinate synthase
VEHSFSVQRHFTVSSKQGPYAVEFLSPTSSLLTEDFLSNKTHCIIDANVSRLHPNIFGIIASRMPVLRFNATEENKSWTGAEEILNFFTENNAHRKSHILVIGGGVTQDTSAFACHIFHRGMPWSVAPTTLLAMADSCIGGKAAINRNGIKNQIGVFDTPKSVFIQQLFLTTLPYADLLSGFGEMLKSHLLAGEKEFAQFENYISKHGTQNSPEITPLIASSLLLKKKIIEIDEFETHERKLLNYGHTLGHALESLTNHTIPHGQAVAWGMACINHIATERGFMSPALKNRVNGLIKAIFPLPFQTPMPTAQELANAAAHDKKRTQSGIEVVVMHKPGKFSLKPFPLNKDAVVDIEKFLKEKQ